MLYLVIVNLDMDLFVYYENYETTRLDQSFIILQTLDVIGKNILASQQSYCSSTEEPKRFPMHFWTKNNMGEIISSRTVHNNSPEQINRKTTTKIFKNNFETVLHYWHAGVYSKFDGILIS